MSELDDLMPGGALRSRLFARLVHGHRPPDGGLPADSEIGPYRIVAPIGRGGFAEVYRAERIGGLPSRCVAIKRVRVTDDRAERALRRERDILASLEHPSIVRLCDSGTLEDGSAWFAMALVEGRRFDAYAREPMLGWHARVELVDQVAAALEHVHARGLVHRDVKPSNVLVDANGHAMLIDFGIAAGLEGEPRAMTPEYASPEQLGGLPVTAASDLYQLGRLLAIVLGSAGAKGTSRPPRRIAASLRAIVARACAEQPTARHGSVTAFRSALRAVMRAPSSRCWRS